MYAKFKKYKRKTTSVINHIAFSTIALGMIYTAAIIYNYNAGKGTNYARH